jgi:hypothetical protein
VSPGTGTSSTSFTVTDVGGANSSTITATDSNGNQATLNVVAPNCG